MSSSKIKPDKFLDLSKSRYLTLLEKDLLLHARKSKLVDFYLLKNYRFGGSKIALLLLIDPEDKAWQPIIQRIESELSNPDAGTGKCKIIATTDKDGNGEDDLVIAIKTCSGGLSKDKAVDLINEELFDQEDDIQALSWNDMEEQEDLLAKRSSKLKIPKTQKLLSSEEWPDWIGESDDSLTEFTRSIDQYLGLNGETAIERTIQALIKTLEDIEDNS
ncbi:MAG: hypothetical protein AAF598_00150 [Bacteroidota bacterium]